MGEVFQAWQVRVKKERDDLGYRLSRLDLFIGKAGFRDLDPVEQTLLKEQARLMRSLLQVMQARVEKF